MQSHAKIDALDNPLSQPPKQTFVSERPMARAENMHEVFIPLKEGLLCEALGKAVTMTWMPRHVTRDPC